MTTEPLFSMTRRQAMQRALTALAALPLSTSVLSTARAQATNRKYLFVVCAGGGADIRDSFMPISSGDAPATVRSHPSADIRTVGGHRCVEHVQPERFYVGAGNATGQNGPVQRTFLTEHGQDLAVMSVVGSSVNHNSAARRWLNGAGLVGRGRTILEAHAMAHATPDMPLPAVNMANAGYVGDGDDPAVPAFARAETAANALLFGMATHPSRGVLPASRGDRQAALLARARSVREQLDNASPFVARHARSRLLEGFRRNRRDTVPLMEELELITRLSMVSQGVVPQLGTYGIAAENAQVDQLAQVGRFTDLITDPFMAQAALAFLLVKSGASCAVAIGAPQSPIAGPGYPGFGFTLRHTPIAYDFSHTDHEPTQAAMWDRTLFMTDGLIRLLKATPMGSGTMWDKSVVYIATEFGRTTTKPSGNGQYGTGHELNNGVALVSPLLRGGRVYGEADPDTGMTTGVDDEGNASRESHHIRGEASVVATLGAALGHTQEGLDSSYVVPALLRS